MGRAQIISGGPDGRYTIRVDVGEARRSQLVAAASQNVAQVTAALAKAQTQLDAADAETEAVRLQAEAAVQAYVDAVATHGPTSMQAGDAFLAYNKLATQLAQARSREFPLRVNRDQLRVTLQMAQARLSRWQSLVLSDTRPAWCADLTETAAGTVGTIEINGESDLILIKPGAPPASGADGALLSRELMSPEQAYYNAGILPGWQKYRPTYRRGTITAINRDTHRCTVVLAAANSSAQRLGINQAGTLSNVPITYMACHSEAFDPGDEVVVQFDNQDQAAPRVIGFVQNPKPCEQYTLIYSMFFTSQTQLVYRGRDADPVTANPPFIDPGVPGAPYFGGGTGVAFVWYGWGDGVVSLSRHDTNITESKVYQARYLRLAGQRVGLSFGGTIIDGATKWRRQLFFDLHSDLTLSKSGIYDSGWTTFEEADGFMMGENVTGEGVHLGIPISATFVIERSSDDSGAGANMRLFAVSTLYAVGP